MIASPRSSCMYLLRGFPMDDVKFWTLIESAWNCAGGEKKARQRLAAGKLSDERAEQLREVLEEVIPALRAQLDKLPTDELLAFDRILERKLFDIDREEVQEHRDGSTDGFLYARGF